MGAIVIGAQVSGKGGVSNAVGRALEIGAEALQVFVDSNLQFPRRPLPAVELEKLRALLRQHRMPGYVHVPYLANVATSDATLRARSIDMVARGLQAAAKAGLGGVVVHPGSHRGRGFDTVRDQVIAALAEAWRRASADATLLIENTAGSGSYVGATVAELRTLIDELDRAGVRTDLCVDFAHVHAAGWDLSRRSGVDAFVSEWTDAGLLSRVALVHGNDSGVAVGSHRDVHANPGTGKIGAGGLRMLAEVPAIARVPWILELPAAYRSGARAVDVTRLRELVTSAATS